MWGWATAAFVTTPVTPKTVRTMCTMSYTEPKHLGMLACCSDTHQEAPRWPFWPTHLHHASLYRDPQIYLLGTESTCRWRDCRGYIQKVRKTNSNTHRRRMVHTTLRCHQFSGSLSAFFLAEEQSRAPITWSWFCMLPAHFALLEGVVVAPSLSFR